MLWLKLWISILEATTVTEVLAAIFSGPSEEFVATSMAEMTATDEPVVAVEASMCREIVKQLLKSTRSIGYRKFRRHGDDALQYFELDDAGEELEAGAYEAMAKALENNVVTKVFSLLIGYPAGKHGLLDIALALSENTTLEQFELDVGVSRTSELLLYLAEALGNHRGLKKFKFHGFFFGCGVHHELMAVASAIACNSTLLHLELDTNGLDTRVVVALAKAIGRNTSLRRCVLRCGQGSDHPPLKLGEEETRAFAKLLRKNQTIQYLDLDGFDHENMMLPQYSALADALKDNYSLKKFKCEPVYVQQCAHAGKWPRELTARKAAVLLRNHSFEWAAMALLARSGGRGSSETGLLLLQIRSELGDDVFFPYLVPSLPKRFKRARPTLFAAGRPGTTTVAIQDKLLGGYSGDTSNVKARSLEKVIDEHILHPDPPARIEAREAEMVVAVQETVFFERQLDTLWSATTELEVLGTSKMTEQVVVVQFKRCPKELLTALKEGPALRNCRHELEAAGHNCVLPNGDMVFVRPDSYRVIMQALTFFERKSSFSILVAESLEYLVEECIMDVGKGATAKSRSFLPISLDSSDNAVANPSETTLDQEQEYWPIVTSRTFLNTSPSHRNPASVTQSSTEVHRGGLNPRRACITDASSSY